MAKVAPGFWTVWLWKSGIWGLVILFGFFYLGSVERQYGDIGGESGLQPESAPGVVSQAEAEAFAQAVMSDVEADSAAAGPAEAIEGDSSQMTVDAFASQAPVAAIPPALLPSREAVPVDAIARSEIPPAAPVSAQAVAVSQGSPVDISSSGLTVAREVVPESPAQQRARIIAEHRTTQRAAWEEMRRRWSGMGGAHPYGRYPYAAYPQWGYPPRIRPQGASTAQ